MDFGRSLVWRWELFQEKEIYSCFEHFKVIQEFPSPEWTGLVPDFLLTLFVYPVQLDGISMVSDTIKIFLAKSPIGKEVTFLSHLPPSETKPAKSHIRNQNCRPGQTHSQPARPAERKATSQNMALKSTVPACPLCVKTTENTAQRSMIQAGTDMSLS